MIEEWRSRGPSARRSGAASTSCSPIARGRDPRRRGARGVRGRRAGRGGASPKSGRAIECDAVVVGAGVRPDTMLAERAGLEVDDGIVCDRELETSAAGIFAAGDVLLATTASSTAAGCGSSTGTSPCSRAATPPAAMLGDDEPYRESCPTSSATSPTGRQPRVRRPGAATGTRSSGAATATAASSRAWYLKDGRSPARSRSAAPRTSPRRGA